MKRSWKPHAISRGATGWQYSDAMQWPHSFQEVINATVLMRDCIKADALQFEGPQPEMLCSSFRSSLPHLGATALRQQVGKAFSGCQVSVNTLTHSVEYVSLTGLEASPGSGRGRPSIPEAGESRWLISVLINVQIQGAAMNVCFPST